MSYYWFNIEKVLEKAIDKYHNCGDKEKATEYYQTSKVFLKEKARNKYKNLSEKEKEAKRQYSRDRYKKIIKMNYYWFHKKKLLKNVWNKYYNKRGKQKAAEYYKKMQI